MNSSALVIASFAADSLALGAHWIYDTKEIDKQIGRIEIPRKPPANSYHKNKNGGDFTHYGDQTLLLLQSIAEHHGFRLKSFADDWQQFMSSYDGYLDKATNRTLENLKAGASPSNCGSSSADLGGAARIAPLVYWYRDDEKRMLEAVREQTRMTHNNDTVLAGAEALAKICGAILHGAKPTEAIEETVHEGIADIDLEMRLRAGLESTGNNTRETIRSFGQQCSIASALPGVIHLVSTYEDDLDEALVENVMAGGDSAARGLCVGMILGAYHGLDAVPVKWLDTMKAYSRIKDLLGSFSKK